MTFIKLTHAETGLPVHVDFVTKVVLLEKPTGTVVGLFKEQDEFRESPAEILALLAEPVAVTDAMVEAALDAEHGDEVAKGYRCSWREMEFLNTEMKRMRAALEAALTARAEK